MSYNKYAYLMHRLTNAEISDQPEVLHIIRPARYNSKAVKLLILSRGNPKLLVTLETNKRTPESNIFPQTRVCIVKVSLNGVSLNGVSIISSRYILT